MKRFLLPYASCRERIVRAAAGALTTFALLVGVVAPGFGAETTVPNVLDAWRQRAERAQTFRLEWTNRYRVARGALNDERGEEERKGRDVPAEPLTYTGENRAVSDGSRLRVELETGMMNVDGGTAELMPDRLVYAFDGEQSKAFMPAVPHADFPRGNLSQGQGLSLQMRANHVAPILNVYRFLDPKLGRKVDWAKHLSVTGERAVIDGRMSHAVELGPVSEAARREGVKWKFWVDPERDFLLLRETHEDRSGVYFQQDYQYRDDPKHGWALAGWKTLFLEKDGSVGESIEGTVTAASFGEPVGEGTFDVEFPAGTLVANNLADQQYIVGRWGGRRLVTAEEQAAGVPYERLVQTDSGRGHLPDQPWGWTGWLWRIIAVGAVAVAAWLVWRSLAHRRGAAAGE